MNVVDSINQLITVFCEKPYLFFTESTIHSYLYKLLDPDSSFTNTNIDRKQYCIGRIHREYPTSFGIIRKKDTQVREDINTDFSFKSFVKNVKTQNFYRIKETRKEKNKEAGSGHYDLIILSENDQRDWPNIDRPHDLSAKDNKIASSWKKYPVETIIEFKMFLSYSIGCIREIIWDFEKLYASIIHNKNSVKERYLLIFNNYNSYIQLKPGRQKHNKTLLCDFFLEIDEEEMIKVIYVEKICKEDPYILCNKVMLKQLSNELKEVSTGTKKYLGINQD